MELIKQNTQAQLIKSIAIIFFGSIISWKHIWSNQPKKLNEAGFSLGGIGFGKLGNGFSNQPKLTIKTWEDYDDDLPEKSVIGFNKPIDSQQETLEN